MPRRVEPFVLCLCCAVVRCTSRLPAPVEGRAAASTSASSTAASSALPPTAACRPPLSHKHTHTHHLSCLTPHISLPHSSTMSSFSSCSLSPPLPTSAPSSSLPITPVRADKSNSSFFTPNLLPAFRLITPDGFTVALEPLDSTHLHQLNLHYQLHQPPTKKEAGRKRRDREDENTPPPQRPRYHTHDRSSCISCSRQHSLTCPLLPAVQCHWDQQPSALQCGSGSVPSEGSPATRSALPASRASYLHCAHDGHVPLPLRTQLPSAVHSSAHHHRPPLRSSGRPCRLHDTAEAAPPPLPTQPMRIPHPPPLLPTQRRTIPSHPLTATPRSSKRETWGCTRGLSYNGSGVRV